MKADPFSHSVALVVVASLLNHQKTEPGPLKIGIMLPFPGASAFFATRNQSQIFSTFFFTIGSNRPKRLFVKLKETMGDTSITRFAPTPNSEPRRKDAGHPNPVHGGEQMTEEY